MGDPCQADAMEKESKKLCSAWRMPGRLQSKDLNMAEHTAVQACRHPHTQAHMHACTQAPAYTRGGPSMRARLTLQPRTSTCTHTRTHTQAHKTEPHPCTHSGIHTCTRTPTHACAHHRRTQALAPRLACAHKNPYSWAPSPTFCTETADR